MSIDLYFQINVSIQQEHYLVTRKLRLRVILLLDISQ